MTFNTLSIFSDNSVFSFKIMWISSSITITPRAGASHKNIPFHNVHIWSYISSKSSVRIDSAIGFPFHMAESLLLSWRILTTPGIRISIDNLDELGLGKTIHPWICTFIPTQFTKYSKFFIACRSFPPRIFCSPMPESFNQLWYCIQQKLDNVWIHQSMNIQVATPKMKYGSGGLPTLEPDFDWKMIFTSLMSVILPAYPPQLLWQNTMMFPTH